MNIAQTARSGNRIGFEFVTYPAEDDTEPPGTSKWGVKLGVGEPTPRHSRLLGLRSFDILKLKGHIMKHSYLVFSLLLGATSIVLTPGRAQGLNNFSTRMDMSPGGTYIMGFSVSVKTTLLLRAVGPSLTQFGVTNPVTSPATEVYDAAGQRYGFGYYMVTVNALPPNDPITIMDAAVGAFAQTGGEKFGVAINFADFNPGSYTIEVINGSGAAGTILFEFYVVPPGTYSQPGTLLPLFWDVNPVTSGPGLVGTVSFDAADYQRSLLLLNGSERAFLR